MSLKSMLAAKERARTSSVGYGRSLVDVIDEQMKIIAQKKKPFSKWRNLDVFHPSVISGPKLCPRLEVIKKLVPDEFGPRKPPGTRLSRIFEFGHSIHSLYQNDILGPAQVLWGHWADLTSIEMDAGRDGMYGDLSKALIVEGFMPEPDRYIAPGLKKWFYMEYAVENEHYNIGGHTDGEIRQKGFPNAILEVKSAGERSFMKKKEQGVPQEEHVKQSNLYMFCKELDYACILYVNKNTSVELEYWIEKDLEVLEPILENIDVILDGIHDEHLPPRHKSCQSERTMKAKHCEACTMCFADDNPKTGFAKLKLRQVING